MKNKKEILGILLALVTGIALLAMMLVRAFLPRMILPNLDGITLTALSLAALVLDHYLTGGNAGKGKRDFCLLPIYALLIFGAFPWLACLVTLAEAGKLAVLGTVVFLAATLLFDTMMDRLSSGPVGKAAPFVSAVGLYLAAQCLMGIV